MSDDNIPRIPSPSVRFQFRRSAKDLCNREVGAHVDSHLYDTDNTKSSAQVETLVSPQVGSPKSCGLKPGRRKPYRVMARVSKGEQDKVIAKAKASNLSLNEFVRMSVLGPTYASSIDPEKRRLLLDINRELSRQGNNLNQIARHLNAGISVQGKAALEELTRSLIDAQMAVRQALAEGRDDY